MAKVNKEFIAALDELAKEKGLDKDLLISKLEVAINQAYDKKNTAEGEYKQEMEISPLADKRHVEIDRKTGEISVFILKEVVYEVEDPATQIALDVVRAEDPDFEVGETVEVDVTPESFESLGRIVATQAKSLMIQSIKECEREMIREEFEGKVGAVVTCTVRSIENFDFRDKMGNIEQRKNVYVSVGKIEGVIEYSEQIPGEEYRPNMTMKAYVLEYKDNKSKGKGKKEYYKDPVLKLSRTHEKLIELLLKQEVVEIDQGVVEIKSIARRAGVRSKIAVLSHNPKVDPVSACVGEKGGRIQNVVDELANEHIDVIRWSPVLEEFIRHSLSPAKVNDAPVEISEEERFDGEKRSRRKVATIVVPDDQLTLAIGNKGLNVSLAAKLTNCKIDIKSEKEGIDRNRELLSQILG